MAGWKQGEGEIREEERRGVEDEEERSGRREVRCRVVRSLGRSCGEVAARRSLKELAMCPGCEAGREGVEGI